MWSCRTRGTAAARLGLADSDELFGDALERVVTWHNQPEVSTLASQPIRLPWCCAMRTCTRYGFGNRDCNTCGDIAAGDGRTVDRRVSCGGPWTSCCLTRSVPASDPSAR